MLENKHSHDCLVENNLGLVHACAKRFKGRGVEYDDLFQAGCLGLVKASKNFDVTKGFAFSTYAVPVIMGEIKRIFRDGGSVKIGRALKEKSHLALKKKEEISVELGREPTVSELAEVMQIDSAEAAMLLNASLPTLSLTCGEDNDNEIDLPVASHEVQISTSIALNQIINSLDERDRQIIKLRYYKNLTQSKTAEILGMTQVQISRREKVILENIRNKMEA